jgi:tetratricopeptide (TPR) repeat protein
MSFKNRIYAIALLCWCCTLQAAGGGGEGGGSTSQPTSADPVIQSARAAIAQQDWQSAQTILLKALTADSTNADFHNLYAYSVRKSANPDMDRVFSHYNEALRLNPKHRGAHEYLGEAYLMTNSLAKAKEQLAALDKLCFFGCEEYSDLKKAIASYEVNHPR